MVNLFQNTTYYAKILPLLLISLPPTPTQLTYVQLLLEIADPDIAWRHSEDAFHLQSMFLEKYHTLLHHARNHYLIPRQKLVQGQTKLLVGAEVGLWSRFLQRRRRILSPLKLSIKTDTWNETDQI